MEMKLEDPLLNLVNRCQTLCVPECCGVAAYDFSPIHIASSLLMWEGKPDPNRVAKLRGQLASLKADYGASGGVASGVIIAGMSQCFSGAEIDALVEEITANLDVALRLCDDAERLRYGSAGETAGTDGGDAAAHA